MAAAVVGTTNLMLRVPRVVQRGRSWLHLVDELRTDAQDVVGAVFPEQGLKRYHALGWAKYHGLVRARNGCESSPLWRLGVWIVALKALGAGPERAQQLVDWLQSLIYRLWPVRELDEHALMLREQELDSQEDLYQVQYLILGDEAARAHYVDTLRKYCAVAGQLALAVEAHGPEVRS